MFILIIVQTAAGENGDVIEEKHDINEKNWTVKQCKGWSKCTKGARFKFELFTRNNQIIATF